MLEALLLSEIIDLSVFRGKATILRAGGDSKSGGVFDRNGDILYSYGGSSTRTGVELSGQVHAYDLKTNQWELVNNAGLPRRNFIGGYFNGRLYVYGGLFYNSEGIGQRTTRLDRFHPDTQGWFSRAPNREIYCHAGCFVGSTLYSFGGYDGVYQRYFDAYDPYTNTWTLNLPTIGSVKCYHAAAALDGKFYISGGWDKTNVLSEFYVYDPATNAWTKRANLPTPRYLHDMVAYRGKLYVMGGRSSEGGERQSEILEYTPDTNLWRVAGHAIFSTSDSKLVTVDDGIVLYSGSGHELMLTKYN